MDDDQMAKWTRFCKACSEVWNNSYLYYVAHDDPGVASWFNIGAQVWAALGEEPEIMGTFYQPIYMMTMPGDVTVVARAAQFIADNLTPRSHWYVEVLRRTSTMWLAAFGPKGNVPPATKVLKPVPAAVVPETRKLDWIEREVAEALVAVRGYHTGACGCREHMDWGRRFDEWASKLGQ